MDKPTVNTHSSPSQYQLKNNPHRTLNQTRSSIRSISNPQTHHHKNMNTCQEESDSGNILNRAFINQDSHLHFSDSESIKSGMWSISDISAIVCPPGKSSPHFLVIEEEISGMQEWPLEQPKLLKRSYKRKNPALEEEQRGGNMRGRCFKKKVDDKRRVVTIDPSVDKCKQEVQQSGYLLRSRVKKIVQKGKSSAQTIIAFLGGICKTQSKPLQR